MKVNNFSAGPSKIPQIVLEEISNDILEYSTLGYSVLEISHRSDIFENLLNETKTYFRKLLNIPYNFEIIFLQGGATFQNTFIPANKPSLINELVFLLTGTWGTKTHLDFEKYFNRDIPSIKFSNGSYDELINQVSNSMSKYLYLTSNETIEGIQIREFNQFKDKKLIIDMSSDICSYEFNWNNVSFVYAGAQKNLGIPGVTVCIFENNFIEENNLTSYMNAKNHVEKQSTFNTPPTFSIYVMLKLLKWIDLNGGIKEISAKNISRANKLYNFLDEENEELIPLAPKEFRSNSNIVFDFKNKNRTKQFLELSQKNGFIGLNGHRSVGGIRVSNYNSINEEMISDLVLFLKKFILSL